MQVVKKTLWWINLSHSPTIRTPLVTCSLIRKIVTVSLQTNSYSSASADVVELLITSEAVISRRGPAWCGRRRWRPGQRARHSCQLTRPILSSIASYDGSSHSIAIAFTSTQHVRWRSASPVSHDRLKETSRDGWNEWSYEQGSDLGIL